MPALSTFKTIPDIFIFLTNVFGKGKSKPIFKRKEKGKYEDVTYDQFREDTENFALGLASLRVKRGNKVAILSENRVEWANSDFAILGLGAIDVPLYPISTSETIKFILNNSEAVGVIVSNEFHLNKILKVRGKVKNLRFIIVMNEIKQDKPKDVYLFNEVIELGKNYKAENPNYFYEQAELAKEDDICTIIYTSGTTGEPKGVLLTHKNIVSNAHSAHQIFDINENDTFLSFLPLSHIFERMAGYYTALSSGATIAFAEGIEKVATNMMEIKPTIMTAVPRLFERIYSRIKRNVDKESEKKQKIFKWALDIGRDYAFKKKLHEKIPATLNIKHKLADKLVLSKIREKTGGRLRFFISGGAALAREYGEFFLSLGLIIIEGYGLTESSPVIAANRLNDFKFGTVGKPMPGVDVKIAADGEILAAGPNIMQGYFKNKKETEAVLKNGWLYTGDIGVFDAEGFLVITDRKKHLFKTSGGKYVAPTPIENMFLASQFIDQFVLIGDRRMFLTALIVPDFEALKEYADAHRISYTDEQELVKLKQIDDLLQNEFSKFQKNLANYERIRKFTMLDKPFTIENGEITPSLKIRRKVIEERYGNLIDDMYSSLERK